MPENHALIYEWQFNGIFLVYFTALFKIPHHCFHIQYHHWKICYQPDLYPFLKIYLCERQSDQRWRERNRENDLPLTGSFPRWQPRAASRSPMCVAGAQALEPSSAASPGTLTGTEQLGLRVALIADTGVAVGGLGQCVTTPAPVSLLVLSSTLSLLSYWKILSVKQRADFSPNMFFW